jgi:hypothetical protein
MLKLPSLFNLERQSHYRIIPSVYPAINFFEDLVDPAEMEILWEIESLTNDRLRQEVGDIFLVAPEDRVSGPGSSVVMAAFTHVNRPTRFTDGSYGIYYASMSLQTAIKETVYHREKFLAATQEPACEITMRVYEGKMQKPLHDIRGANYKKLHHPREYAASQKFAKALRKTKSWGLIYNSVRHLGGECLAVFRPPALSIPIQSQHLRYVWNKERITQVFSVKSI